MRKKHIVLRRSAAVAAVAAAFLLVLPRAGSAQVPDLIPRRTPTPSPSPSQQPPPPQPSPTPDPEPIRPPDPNPNPTPQPSASSKPTPKASSKPKATSPSGGGSGGGSRGGSPSQGGSRRSVKASSKGAPARWTRDIADGIQIWLDRERTPARTTTRLLELVAALHPEQKTLTTPQIAAGFGRFPVAGYVWYQDDWAAPRFNPYFHLHEGTDLFAKEGTPVIATTDGVIRKIADGSIGGLSIWLDGDDGITYYYGHLAFYAKKVRPGLRVRMGEVIGGVGATGVAQGTYPHVHFEVHPFAGPPINAKPMLDRWLEGAERAAKRRIVERTENTALARLGAARWDALVGLIGQSGALTPSLWGAALDPAGATLGLADLALGSLASSIDWQAIRDGEAVRGAGAGYAEIAVRVASDPFTSLTPEGSGAVAGPRRFGR